MENVHVCVSILQLTYFVCLSVLHCISAPMELGECLMYRVWDGQSLIRRRAPEPFEMEVLINREENSGFKK